MFKKALLIFLHLFTGYLHAETNVRVTKPFNPVLLNNQPEQFEQSPLQKIQGKDNAISLNFQNIEVRAALQLLAEFTGINIVVNDTVTGNITLRLNDIAWDLALGYYSYNSIID